MQTQAGNEEMLLRLTEVNVCTSFVIRLLANMRVVYNLHLAVLACVKVYVMLLFTNAVSVGSGLKKTSLQTCKSKM